ncbi:MAG: hypothetical protein J6T55_00595 [Alphaproteobacteria bacterium]|nr:hypothetical protein [Alphaproteobacteria bacterium]
MLIYEGLGYNRLGLPYESAEEMEARKKRIFSADVSQFNKEKCNEKLSKHHEELQNKLEADRKAKVRDVQIMAFLALSVASFAVEWYHLSENNITLATGNALCGTASFVGAMCFAAPYLKRASSKQRG